MKREQRTTQFRHIVLTMVALCVQGCSTSPYRVSPLSSSGVPGPGSLDQRNPYIEYTAKAPPQIPADGLVISAIDGKPVRFESRGSLASGMRTAFQVYAPPGVHRISFYLKKTFLQPAGPGRSWVFGPPVEDWSSPIKTVLVPMRQEHFYRLEVNEHRGSLRMVGMGSNTRTNTYLFSISEFDKNGEKLSSVTNVSMRFTTQLDWGTHSFHWEPSSSPTTDNDGPTHKFQTNSVEAPSASTQMIVTADVTAKGNNLTASGIFTNKDILPLMLNLTDGSLTTAQHGNVALAKAMQTIAELLAAGTIDQTVADQFLAFYHASLFAGSDVEKFIVRDTFDAEGNKTGQATTKNGVLTAVCNKSRRITVGDITVTFPEIMANGEMDIREIKIDPYSGIILGHSIGATLAANSNASKIVTQEIKSVLGKASSALGGALFTGMAYYGSPNTPAFSISLTGTASDANNPVVESFTVQRGKHRVTGSATGKDRPNLEAAVAAAWSNLRSTKVTKVRDGNSVDSFINSFKGTGYAPTTVTDGKQILSLREPKTSQTASPSSSGKSAVSTQQPNIKHQTQNVKITREEFVVKLPTDLKDVEFPSGTELRIDIYDVKITNNVIEVNIVSRQDVDSFSVFYLTREAGASNIGTDVKAAASLVELWKKSYSINASIKNMASHVIGGGRIESKLGGVTDFAAEKTPEALIIKAKGQLPIKLAELEPRAIGLVAIRKGAPVSNFIWVPLDATSDLLKRVRVEFASNQTVTPVVSNNTMTVDNSLSRDTFNKSTPKTHKDSVKCAAVSTDGKLLASSGLDAPFYVKPSTSSIKLWTIPEGNIIARLPGHSAHSIAFAPDGKSMAFGENNTGIIKILGLPDGKLISHINGTTLERLSIGLLTISPDGKLLASATGAYDKQVKIWSFPDGAILQTISNQEFVAALAFSPDNQMLAVGSSDIGSLTGKTDDYAVNLWRVSDGQKQSTLAVKAISKAKMGGLTFSPDGKFLAGAGAINSELLCVWSLPDGKLVSQPLGGDYSNKTFSLHSVAISQDSRLLATGAHDGTITVRTFPEGSVVKTFTGHGGSQIYSVCFAQNGKILISRGNDNRICLWELDGEKRCKVFFDAEVPNADTKQSTLHEISKGQTEKQEN